MGMPWAAGADALMVADPPDGRRVAYGGWL